MDHFRLDAKDVTLIISCVPGTPPSILHWGKRLSAAIGVEEVRLLGARLGGPGSPDAYVAASMALEPGLGLLGPSGFSAHRDGRDWGSLFTVRDVQAQTHSAKIACHDPNTQIALDYNIALDPDSGILTISTAVTNQADSPLELVEMATAALPIPQHMEELIGFSGRWTDEFRRERLSRFSGGYVRENRRGRTSHDSFPAVILCAANTNEGSGEAYGVHLAWSGNHRLRVDTLLDGRVLATAGALLWLGEVILAPGQTYESPQLVCGYSTHGLSALSRSFHSHVRENLLRPSTRNTPRPVHYNTWEAVYFDHDPNKLIAIASRAAAIGVERFVLDDGWFGARRNDTAGLGDWITSSDVYPDGLKPLVDHVTGLGMKMGIWFEPEMVNPDSDLYRAHPDWALKINDVNEVPFRNQYVLDISRAEVSDYLFARIDAVLRDHDIGYIKWDMNRDLNHPGDNHGQPRAFAQVTALYTLIDRIRAAHPHVEIESCASGGARPDMGILAHTDRIWTSDSNDAHDRQAIQRGASYFLPLDVLGAHVGPSKCHQTGRKLSMAMRCGTALMGHMGMELNLLTEPEADLAELQAAVALYKQHRALLHSGDHYRVDTPAYLNASGVVASDKSEALYSVAFISGHAMTVPDRIFFAGLDSARNYRLRLIWPMAWKSHSTPPADQAIDFSQDAKFSGEALMALGMQLPLTYPDSVLLFHLAAE
jgi:alpha-galactosidase